MEIKPAIILWDFNGVLLDDDIAVYSAMKALFDERGLVFVTIDDFRHRMSNHWSYYRMMGLDLTDEEMSREFFERYESTRCDLTAGVDHTLGVLGDMGIRCGVVSAYPQAMLETRLAQLGIAYHFEQVFGGTYDKVEGIQTVCARMEVPTRLSWYVGDIISDVRHARKADSISVLYAPDDSPYKQEARYHITTIPELLLRMNG